MLKRNKLNQLPENKKRSRNKFTRYEKKVPGLHVQVDVKFLFFKDNDGNRIKRFQYTAIPAQAGKTPYEMPKLRMLG